MIEVTGCHDCPFYNSDGNVCEAANSLKVEVAPDNNELWRSASSGSAPPPSACPLITHDPITVSLRRLT